MPNVPDYGLLDTAAPERAGMAPIRGFAAYNQLRAQQLENQAAEQTMQNALAEQAAYRQGGDIGQNLRGAGLGKQAAAYEANQSNMQSASLERAAAKIKIGRSLITDATTPDQLKHILGGQYQDSDIGPIYSGMGMNADKMTQLVDTASADPAKYQQFLRQVTMGMDAAEQHTIQEMNAINGRMNAIKGEKSLGIQERNAGIQERRLGIAEEELGLKKEAAARKAADLTAELPVKEIQKRNAGYAQAKSNYEGHVAKSQSLVNDIDSLISNPGLTDVTGYLYGHKTPMTTLSDNGRKALTLIDKIKAEGTFKELRDLKAAGGSLGTVSNADTRLLADAFASLGRTQSTEDFIGTLNQIKQDIQESDVRLKDAFDETYSYRNAQPAAPAAGGKATGAMNAYQQYLDSRNR